MRWDIFLAVYLISINLLAFLAMGLDKHRAQRNSWRIPEKTLFFFPLLGGSVGGIMGMKLFHHKTKHWYFRFGFPAILVLQIVLLFCIVHFLL